MVVRLSAVVFGVAIMFACSSAAMAHNRIAHDASIVGTASTYNPYRPGYREGGPETSSGERYNSSAWTAAIKTDLREKFGNVHGGKARYALVEGGNKKVIVKINDVGPLEPGRIIDLNERAMRYFDPSLQRGLVPNVKVTPLRGDDWTPGPIAGK
jgi:rare lipoprotein A